MATQGKDFASDPNGVTVFGKGSDGKIYALAVDPITGQLIAQLAATPTIDIGDVTLLAGSALVGKVGIDQTAPGTTDSVSVSTAQGAGAAIGATTGAAVITDANGTIQQYLRGIVKLWLSGLSIVGLAAHDAVVSGAPVRIGARAQTSNVVAVATGDAVDQVATLVGATIQKPYSIPEEDWSYPAAAGGIVNTTAAVTIKAAAAAGIRNYVTGLQISSDPLGAATELVIRDGAAGAVLWRMKIGTGGLAGGLQIAFVSPLKGTAATLLEAVTLTASVTGGVFVNAQGYQAP